MCAAPCSLRTAFFQPARSPPLHCPTSARSACCAAKASLRFLAFDHEGRPIQFDTWLDDLQLYLLSDSRDSISLFDHTSGAAPAPPATADSATRSQWLTRDTAARLASRNHLPLAECAHFGQHRRAPALYDAVVARYSSPATAALGRLLLPYLFPELDHFLALDPTALTVDLLKQHLLAAETSVVAVGAALGTLRMPFFEGCSPSPLAPSYASAAAADVPGAADVGAASASVKRRSSKGKGGRGGGTGSNGGGGGSSGGGGGSGGGGSSGSGGGSGGFGGGGGGNDGSGGSGSGGSGGGRTGAQRGGNGVREHAEGDYYLCVPFHPIIQATALGASESVLLGTAPAEALHTIILTQVPHALTVRPSPPLALYKLGEYRCPPRRDGHYHHSWGLVCVDLHVYTDGPSPGHVHSSTRVESVHTGYRASSGSCVYPGSTPLLVSPPVASDPYVAPQPGSPLPTTPSWHALPPPCLWSSQVSASPPTLACPALPSLCRGAAARRSSLLLVSPDDCSLADSPHGHRRIGLVMEVPRTSMIHAAAPHFLWLFAVRYAAHQLNLWPRLSLPETFPTLRWTGKVGDATVFRVRGSRAYVRDTSADKLSARAIPCVFLGFSLDAHGWQFYHPTSRRVFPSQDVTFDESVPFYYLFPNRSAPPPPPPLFLAPGPPPVDPLPSKGPSPSVVSQVDPLPGTAPVEVAVQVLRLGVLCLGRTRFRSGAAGAGDSAAGDTRAGVAGVTAGAGGTGGAVAAGPRGARTGGTGAARTGGVGGAGAGDPTEPRAAGAGGARAVGAGARGTSARGTGAGGAGAADPRAGDTSAGGAGAGGAGASPLSAPSPYVEQTGGLTERCEPASPLASPVRTGRRVPRPHPPRALGTHATTLRPSSVSLRVPPSPPPESSLPAIPDPESGRARAASPTVSRLLATVVTDPSFESTAASALVAELVDFAVACCLDYASALVAGSTPASPPSVGGECAVGTDVLEVSQEDFECLAAAVPRFASMLLAPEGDLDAPDILTPRSYAEAITGPYSSQWQTAMDAEMASWKSTGTYVDAVSPCGANIVDGMWIFRGVDYFQTFSPTPKMTTLRVLLHVAAQRDYDLHSLDFSTAFLQGSLHEEIWLRRPPGFTGSFPAGNLELGLSKALNHTRADELLADTIVERPGADRSHAIWLISLKGVGAGDWLHAVSTRADLSIPPGQFSLALGLRFGMELPLAEVCPCKRANSNIADKSLTNHLLRCANGGDAVRTHNALVYADLRMA
ncbi:unnamed protein product [Closterium sp. NIES-53]